MMLRVFVFLLVVFSSMTIACTQPGDQQDEDMPAGSATMKPMPEPSPTETPSITAPTIPAVMVTPSPTRSATANSRTNTAAEPDRDSDANCSADSAAESHPRRMTPSAQPTPTVPPIPYLAIMHDGVLHSGWLQELRWPTESGSTWIISGPMHPDTFRKQPSITVRRGDDIEVVIPVEGADPFELSVSVSQVQASGDFEPGGWYRTYSSSTEKVVTLDLPPGLSVLSARYEWGNWFVFYKIQS